MIESILSSFNFLIKYLSESESNSQVEKSMMDNDDKQPTPISHIYETTVDMSDTNNPNNTVKTKLNERRFLIDQELRKKIFMDTKCIDSLDQNSMVKNGTSFEFDTWIVSTEIRINDLKPEALERLAKDAGYDSAIQLFEFNYYVDDVIGLITSKDRSKIKEFTSQGMVCKFPENQTNKMPEKTTTPTPTPSLYSNYSNPTPLPQREKREHETQQTSITDYTRHKTNKEPPAEIVTLNTRYLEGYIGFCNSEGDKIKEMNELFQREGDKYLEYAEQTVLFSAHEPGKDIKVTMKIVNVEVNSNNEDDSSDSSSSSGLSSLSVSSNYVSDNDTGNDTDNKLTNIKHNDIETLPLITSSEFTTSNCTSDEHIESVLC